MEVIMFEKESFYKLIEEVVQYIKSNLDNEKKEIDWIDESQAKQILGIKSRTKMQQLRDAVEIEFSQFGKTIRYSKSSILDFLERNRVKRFKPF